MTRHRHQNAHFLTRQMHRQAVAVLLIVGLAITLLPQPIRGQSRGKEALRGAAIGAIVGGVTGLVVFLARSGHPLEIEPSQVDFATVKTDSQGDRVVAIRNKKNKILRVTSISLSEGAFSIVSSPQAPFELTPGRLVEITLRFRPVTSGKFRSTLEVKTEEPSRDRLIRSRISLRGKATR
ncbi:MAG: hypothetical protein L0387_16330 [Acidobacteria bacterium]|nr:hypothetical protein [Acidobacteriota bacterium]MCI0724574.1 hypothetical protein [Acidobacteriota bacterium]